MSDLILSPVEQVSEELPLISLGMVLTDPLKIPHVSLISGKDILSLTVKGVSIKRTADYFESLKRKRLPALFVRLNIPEEKIDFDMICKEFITLGKVDESQHTCIEPIKGILTKLYAIDFMKCGFVYEIMDVLLAEGLVHTMYSSRIGNDSPENSVSIRRYTRDEVNTSIADYRNRITENDASSR